MLKQTHKFIIKKALSLTKEKFKEEHKLYIIDGCINEDNPKFSFDKDSFQIIGSHHFYHPLKKRGYLRYFDDAKNRGLHYFNKSLKLYKQDKKKESFIFLGKSLHLLADIASPSHTRLEYHIMDIFEHYIDYNLPKFKLNLKATILPKVSPDFCFDRVASLSYKVKYKRNWFSGLLYVLGLHKDKDNHKNLHKISNKLISSTILYSAILLSIFHSKIRNYDLNKKTKLKLKGISSKAKEIKEDITDDLIYQAEKLKKKF